MSMNASRRRLLLSALALGAAGRAAAQSGPRPYKITAITFRAIADLEKGFQDYFTARRIPVDIQFRDLGRDMSKMAGFVAEIRQTRPDLIYCSATPATLGLVGPYDKVDPAKHITDIPVVFTLVAAPVLAKIVPDLRSSRRNVTGVYHVAPTEAQMRAMASYRPFKTVGMIYTEAEQNSVILLQELRAIAQKQGFTVIAMPFKLDAQKKATAEGVPEMIRMMKEQKADWLYLPADTNLLTQSKAVVLPAAMENNLPTFAATESFLEIGALAGLVSRFHSIGQFTAYKAEQILVGKVPPANVPIETLTRFSLQVRVDVAEALKLPPPLPMFNYAELLNPAK
jgi:putative ABC transport system substrate-binding protein